MTDIDAILAEKGSFVKNAVNVLYLMKMLVYIKNLSQNSPYKRFRECIEKNKGDYKMQILWIRHGQTPGNVQRRYVGRTDEGLTDEAKLCLQKKQVLMQDLCVQTEGGRNPEKWYHAGAFVPDFVYISPMMRCRETAEILFPGQVFCVQEGLQETDFGDFEYKNYEELKENPAYQAWIDSGGQMMVPNGESGAGFRHRCCRAYEQCVRDAQEKGAQRIAIVCHGGTIMSVLERYGRPEKSFYEWQIANGCGILTETIEEGGYHYGIREIGKWE